MAQALRFRPADPDLRQTRALDRVFLQAKLRQVMVDTQLIFNNQAKVFTPTRLAVDMEVLEEPVTRQVDRVTKTANTEATKVSAETHTETMEASGEDGAATTDTNWPRFL